MNRLISHTPSGRLPFSGKRIQYFFLPQIEAFASQLLLHSLPEHLYYHNLTHSREVAAAAYEIGKKEGLSDRELEIVQIAGWLHDVGFTETYDGHEAKGIEIAQEFLLYIGYPEKDIQSVTGCILATRMPQSPQNKLEEVLCDADLYHLSTSSFFHKLGLLRREWNYYRNENCTEPEWIRINFDFLSGQRYFTRFGQTVLAAGLAQNLDQLLRIAGIAGG
jgi:predicted metal-dependent HD superfamily phosphohydrolase